MEGGPDNRRMDGYRKSVIQQVGAKNVQIYEVVR